MRITCRDCRTDFVVSVEEVGPRGYASSCPFCQASFRIVPSTAAGHSSDIIFEDRKIAKRTCLTCSREYAADMTEVLPICPNCRKEVKKKPAQREHSQWKVFRDGRMIELASEGSVEEWIRMGEIRPDDPLISPQGKTAAAKRFGKFRSALREQKPAPPPARTSTIIRLFRRYYRPAELSQGFGFLFMAFAASWAIYRVVTYQPPLATPGELAKFATHLMKRVPPPSRPSDALMEQGRKVIASDRPEELEVAMSLCEQALVADPTSADAFALLVLAYGFTAAWKQDPRFSAATLDTIDFFQRLFPRRVEGLVAKARTALGSRNVALARSSSQQALEVDPENAWALLTRSRVLISLSQDQVSLDQAISLATRAGAQNPSLLEAYDLSGEALFLKAEPAASLDAFERRLAQAPNDPRALYRIGTIQERGRDYAGAKRWYQDALRASSTFSPARLELALIYSRIDNNLALAERHLRDIGTRYRNHAREEDLLTASRELIRILTRSGREIEAAELARTLPVILSDSPDLVISQSRAIRTVRGDQGALNAIDAFLAGHPNSAEAQFERARILERKGSVEDAVRSYRAVLAERPEWLDPYFYLVNLLIEKKRDDEALDVADATVSRAGLRERSDLWRRLDSETLPLDSKSFVTTFQKLSRRRPDTALGYALTGLAQMEAGQLQAALVSFRRAKSLGPALEYTNVYTGRVLLALGDTDAALAAFREAIRINPISAMSHYWMGRALTRQKRLSEAERALTIASADTVWGYRALSVLGDLAAVRGDRLSAEGFWRRALEKEPAYAAPWRSLLSRTDVAQR
ncbi:MAG: tetratricopeptide repeat protein [Pseudomonadota bacterium]